MSIDTLVGGTKAVILQRVEFHEQRKVFDWHFLASLAYLASNIGKNRSLLF